MRVRSDAEKTVFGRTALGHLLKGWLFVGALREVALDEVSRSRRALCLAYHTSPALGSGHQQHYCFP